MLSIFRKRKNTLISIGTKYNKYGIPSHYYEYDGKYYMQNKGVGMVEVSKADAMTVTN
jgi:hypothetical protein